MDVRIGTKAIYGVVLSLIALMAVCLRAQTIPDQASFEVASVKPYLFDSRRPGYLAADPSRVDFVGFDLAGLVMQAYEVRRYQVVGPASLATELYEVHAKLPAGSRNDQVPAMLRNLLAERFHLRAHWEDREETVYALVSAKSAKTLKKSADEEKGGIRFSSNGHLEVRATTLTEFAAALTGCCLDRPVIDASGIQGRFDISLDVAKEDWNLALLGGGSDESREANAAFGSKSIFAALRGLGLDLQRRKASVKYVVVDEVEKVPTSN